MRIAYSLVILLALALVLCLHLYFFVTRRILRDEF